MITRFLILVLCCAELYAQAPGVKLSYRREESDFIPAQVYHQRREKIRSMHSERSVILLLSADVRNRQNDVDYEFRQNSNFLYLSGCTEPKTALILLPKAIELDGKSVREVFFVRERDTKKETWTGVTMGIDEAEEFLGVEKAVDYKRLTSILDTLLRNCDTLFIASGLPTGSVESSLTSKRVSIEQIVKDSLHATHPDLYIKTALADLPRMREIKDAEEIRLMKRAIDISIDAHLATIKAARPGMNEYELEAEMEYHFHKAGAEDLAYPSIVGSGYNSCILHYESNRKLTKNGDIILADCGAEYHGYASDITRSFPINGQFTADQRTIYSIVLEAQDSGIAACRAGNDFRESHRVAYRVVQRGLLQLGIIKDSSDAKYYFMHGTSHYLGLDVHDAGTFGPLKPGVVMTVEPGIYIPEGSPCDKRWWQIGVRIEDDILVTESDPINLSDRLPRHPDQIEALMKKAE